MAFKFNAVGEECAGSSFDPVTERFLRRTPKSTAMTERAAKVMPGGETRAASYHAPCSVTIDHGAGAKLFDIDGNNYFDLINNFTVLVHGHAYPPVVEAIRRAARNSTTWVAKAESQIELAEITARTARLETFLAASAAKHYLPFSTRRFHSLLNLYFSDEAPPVNKLRRDDRLAGAFQLVCMSNGMVMVMRLVLNCSTVMTDADMDETEQRFEAAMAEVAALA